MTKTSPATSSDDTRPVQVRLHRRSRTLELVYGDGRSLHLKAAYLRAFSPSAKAPDAEPETGLDEIAITDIQPQGGYALRLIFADGHASGIYTWPLLKSLAENYETNWRGYLARLRRASAARLAPGTLASSSHPRVEIHEPGRRRDTDPAGGE